MTWFFLGDAKRADTSETKAPEANEEETSGEARREANPLTKLYSVVSIPGFKCKTLTICIGSIKE